MIAETFIKHIPIINSWETLHEFVDWYQKAGMPMLPPPDFELYKTDDAVAFPVFRAGRYQVEMYIVADPDAVPVHSHPGVDLHMQSAETKQATFIEGSFIVRQDSAPPIVNTAWKPVEPMLPSGQEHGGVSQGDRSNRFPNGSCFLVYSRWPAKVRPHTVSAVWKGKTVGPLHVELIKRFFPAAFVDGLYVDITRSS